MKIKQLPEISVPLIVFGGPYSNYQALLAMREICNEQNIPPQHTICTGDIVAYCARPIESIELIVDWGIHVIAGNVELQLASDQTDCGCNFTEGSVCDTLSNKWYTYARRQLTTSHIAWLKTLPEFIRFSIAGYECVVVHGAYSQTAKFIYRSTSWSEKHVELELANADVIVAGHCGIPFLQCNDNLDQNAKIWANAGVLGMPPNDGTHAGWYLTITPTHNELKFQTRTFSYDNQTAANEIEEANLAEEYAESLRTGIWPSNDILPDVEKAQQGQPLILENLSVPLR